MKKEFKTIKEQREYLVSEKNISDSELIEKVLKERTYVSLINTYKEFFYTSIDAEGRHVYSKEIDFSKYINLAALDDNISNILHKYVGIFERKLKFVIAYEYSKFLTNDKNDPTCTNYLTSFSSIVDLINNEQNNDYCVFDEHLKNLGLIRINEGFSRIGKLGEIDEKYRENTIQYRKKLLKNIFLHSVQQEGVKKSEIIEHYVKTQGIPPFWLLVHQISLGDLVVLCGMFNATIRENIYMTFKEINERGPDRRKDVNKFYLQLDTIKNIRNTINHYEPLIVKFKTFKVDKLKPALKLLKETFDKSVIANYKDANIEIIEDTLSNKTSKEIFKLFLDIFK
jgi:hypothetical protein